MKPELYITNDFKDLIKVFKIRVSCWEVISEVKHDDHPHGMIEDHDYDTNTIHYVMKIGEKIVGGARLKICHKLQDVPDYEVYEGKGVPFAYPIGHLGKLVVLPEFQGRGLSRFFDDARYQKSKELGVKLLLGWTHTNSRRLWHKLNSDGFCKSGLININNYSGTWVLGNGEIIYKKL